jgi:8-oxo-dGTP diphosphatase
VTHIRHNYRHGGAVDLQFFGVYEFRGEIENRIFNDVRWVKLEELPNYDFLVADRGLIKDLAQGKLL